MKTLTISLPIYYEIEFKTKKNTIHLVGSNWLRNIHHHVKNKVKTHYHKLVSEALQDNNIVFEGKYSTKYKYCYKSKVSDPSNVISQIEKFALDGLKLSKVVIDDSVKYHVKSDGWTIEEDKTNPRIEITIKEIL